MVYFFPEITAGQGMGHVHRVSLLSTRLGTDSAVLVPPDAAEPDHRRRVREHIEAAGARVVEDLEDHTDGAIIFDRRHVRPEEVRALPPGLTVAGIDTAGPAREELDALLDTLPAGPIRRSRGRANESGVYLPRLPGKVRESLPRVPERILVTFGGEDAAQLTEGTVTEIRRIGLLPGQSLTAVQGPLMTRQLNVRAEVLLAPTDLIEHLADYDLVITSYGITAFEALAAGCRVVLVNPTRYHARLAAKAGLPRAGSGGIRRRELRRGLRDGEQLDAALAAGARPQAKELADLVAQYRAADQLGCPVCRRRRNRPLARMPGRSYFVCEDCGMVYLTAFSENPIHYDEQYFFAEYRAQYGRTYLEDFDHIAGMGRRRLEIIERLLRAPEGAPRILDVGCAYGPFLSAVAGAGYEPYGMDVSAQALAFVRQELGLPAMEGAAGRARPDEHFSLPHFDVVTMWYVIEHIDALDELLPWVADLLAPGGVFAFSTPSLSGISGRRDLPRFLERSPRDHRTVWSPRIARKVLPRFGFTVRRIRSTGHHPERHRLGEALPVLQPLLLWWSRLFRLGDTFEVYAVKRRREETT